MSNVIPFVPRSEVSAKENLEHFVEHARTKLTMYGANLDFDSNIWDITDSVDLKGKAGLAKTILFGTKQPGTDDKSRNITPFKGDFLGLAKAYMRYMEGMRPTKNYGGRIAVLRFVSEVLDGKSVTLLEPIDLNMAIELIKERYSKDLAYRSGQQLELFYEFLRDKHLVKQAFTWRNSIKRPSSEGRVGREADKRREEKMPSQAALDALPKIFRSQHLSSRDELVVCMCALLCCAPDRISELLELPLNCEFNGTDSDGQPTYGLRWWPAKGASPYIKWMIPSMVDVAKEALSRIRRITEPARELARWYENNPNTLYLPAHLEHLRDVEILTTTEITALLGLSRVNANLLLKSEDFEPYVMELSPKGASKNKEEWVKRAVKFADFERVMLSRLPKDFPYLNRSSDLKFSEMLLVGRVNEHVLNKPIYPFLFEPISIGFFNNSIGDKGGAENHKSIFDRHGFTEEDGTRISMNSHQFRHYLNTLASAGGLSGLDIAKWSGRKDVSQNAAYDHVTGREMVQMIRNAIGDADKSVGPIALYRNKSLIPRDEFSRLVVPTAHTTDIGYCVHDYSMSPCEEHRDCLNCKEMVCIKGDQVAARNIKKALDESTMLLEAAQKEMNAETYGANRWVDHHRNNHERLSQLNQILDNPTIQDGTVIQLFLPKKQITQEAKKLSNDQK